MFLNHFMVFGRLVAKPELKTAGKIEVVNARIAFSPNRKPAKDKDDGQFIDIVVFGKTAEVLAKYGDKGDGFIFEGALSQDTWKDKKTGEERRSFEMQVNNIIFPGKGSSEDQKSAKTSDTEVPF